MSIELRRIIPPIAGGQDPPIPDPKDGDGESKKDSTTAGSKNADKESESEDKKPVPYERFQEVNSELKSMRAELKKLQDATDERAKADDKAEKARLKEKEDWKQLAEKHETELELVKAERDLLKTKTTSMTTVVAGLVDDLVKDMPDEVKQLDPGGDDPLPRLEWARKAQAVSQKLKGQPAPKGNSTSPRPSRQDGVDESAAKRSQNARIMGNF